MSMVSVMRGLFLLFSGLVLAMASSQQYVAFDAASASSTHSAGNLAGSPAFAAQQALSAGSGYWLRVVLICGRFLVLRKHALQVLQWQSRPGPERSAQRWRSSCALRRKGRPMAACASFCICAHLWWRLCASFCICVHPWFRLRCHMDRCLEFSPWGARSGQMPCRSASASNHALVQALRILIPLALH